MARELAPGIVMEIDPRMELLSAVLLNTTGARTGMASNAHLTPYAEELKSLFAEDRENRAIKTCQMLLARGFDYDAPPNLVLATEGELEFTIPRGGFSAYLVKRAWGPRKLEEFTSSLRVAAEEHDFPAFWADHRAYYAQILDKASQGLEAGRLSAWLKDYYGSQEACVFHYVLAPALFPAGGYGSTVERSENGSMIRHVYQVVREADSVAGTELASLALHEFGHSFVNPSIGESIPARARSGLERIFAPVREKMGRMAYGELPIFLNELVLRAAVIRGEVLLGLIDEAGTDAELFMEESLGFYLIREVYTELISYETARETYQDFAAFGPILLARLAADAPELMASAPTSGKKLENFSSGFEEAIAGPGLGFTLGIGASNSGTPRLSRLFIDSRNPHSGISCLTLSGSADTTRWIIASLPIKVRAGKLELAWAVRGTELKAENGQFDNAYLGLIIRKKGGRREFKVQSYSGTFDWKLGNLEFDVKPVEVENLEVAIFLSKSGELSVDNLEARYH